MEVCFLEMNATWHEPGQIMDLKVCLGTNSRIKVTSSVRLTGRVEVELLRERGIQDLRIDSSSNWLKESDLGEEVGDAITSRPGCSSKPPFTIVGERTITCGRLGLGRGYSGTGLSGL